MWQRNAKINSRESGNQKEKKATLPDSKVIQREIEQFQTREQTLLAISVGRIRIIDPTWPDNECAILVDSEDTIRRTAPGKRSESCPKTLN